MHSYKLLYSWLNLANKRIVVFFIRKTYNCDYYLMDYNNELEHISYGTSLCYFMSHVFLLINFINVYTLSSVKIILLFIQLFMYC